VHVYVMDGARTDWLLKVPVLQDQIGNVKEVAGQVSLCGGVFLMYSHNIGSGRDTST